MEAQLPFSCRLETIFDIQLLVPVEAEVKLHYQQQQQLHGNHIPFPYWTRLWASSVALSGYIMESPELVSGKNILELGAGLALPSFVGSRYASNVICSDYLNDAVMLMKENIRQLNLRNVQATQIDWTSLEIPDDVNLLLLSDVNYDPFTFDHLHRLISRYLSSQDKHAMISTPQRLTGKAFFEKLDPFISMRTERNIFMNGVATNISVMLLSPGL